MACAILLGETQHGACCHNDQHDGCIHPLLDDGGNDRGKNQDQHERVGELGKEHLQGRIVPARFETIGAKTLQTVLSLGSVQPINCTSGFPQQVVRHMAPVWD
ncbi:hypothetical protein SDC9_168453 [bioreactor metagenome]|uniref:Uncharacterized protein n=1 Tax=bioreactor metagenome TaxID=1076179 RepID=A0A645GAH9_9ZZZZ